MRYLLLSILLSACVIPLPILLPAPEIRTDNPRRSILVTPGGRIYAVFVDQPEVVQAACESAERQGCVKVRTGSIKGEVWMVDSRRVEDHECGHVREFDKPWTPELIERVTSRHSLFPWGLGERAREKPCQE